MTIRDGQGQPVGCAARELPIQANLAYDTYTCPCPRRALLDVGLTVDKRWVLREHKPTQDQRREINMIAHALVTGQARDKGRPPRRQINKAPHAISDHMGRAHLAAYRLFRQANQYLLADDFQRAKELAEQAAAADHAYQLHERAYRREERLDIHEAAWHHAERFFIQFDPPQGKSKQPVSAEPGYHPTFTFRMLALWAEERGRWEVVNAAEIELHSGLEVGADGWRALMDLLVYLRGEVVNDEPSSKPGAKVDTRALIYRLNKGTLVPRSFVQRKHRRALDALEALRRTLAHEGNPPREEVAEPEWLTELLGEGDPGQSWMPEWARKERDALPDWAADQLGEGRVRPYLTDREGDG